MKRFYSNIIWFTVLLFISGIILLLNTCCCKYSELFKDILIGLFSAVLLLLLSEIRDLIRDNSKYGYLEGTYKRTKIFDVNHSAVVDSRYISLEEQYKNVSSEIHLKYIGDRKYTVDATYELGKVKATIYLDQTNPLEGNGNYQYLNLSTPDLGTYKILVDNNDFKRIFVYYKNIIPSGLAEGYEVWQRT